MEEKPTFRQVGGNGERYGRTYPRLLSATFPRISASPVLLIEEARTPKWYEATRMPLMPAGIMPFYRYVIRMFYRYVIRMKGKVEMGTR
jgi:hypothetical protein